MTYQENIKTLRIDRDITQQQIAKYLGVAQTTYSQYERGTRPLPLDFFIALCQFYEVSLDDVAGVSGNRMPLPDNDWKRRKLSGLPR